MKQRLLVQRMQDILLDEECAFYTSRTQDQHRTAPLCRDLLNPLARTFHLQEALVSRGVGESSGSHASQS